MGNERGYTMAEMLVVCAIVGLVMASFSAWCSSGQQAFWYGTTQVDAQQTARVAVERMVKEIREAGYYPQAPIPTRPGPARPPLLRLRRDRERPTATSLTLQYDWNGDGASAGSGMVNDPFLCATGAALPRRARGVNSFSGGALTRQEIGVDGSPR